MCRDAALSQGERVSRAESARGRWPRRWPGRGRGPVRWAVDIVLVVTCVVSVLFEPMSIAVHSVVGLVFVAAVGPHLWNRRAWIRGTLRRLWSRRSLSRAMRWSLGQAGLLLALTLVVTASGLWDWLDERTRIRWHAISSVILIAVVIRHAWTRRGWLLRRRAAASATGDASRGHSRGAGATRPQ
jgi:hypothetical protein